MKKKLSVFIMIMAIFLQGSLSYAYPSVFNDVELGKQWSIKFTKPVDVSTLTPENIGVLDFNNKRIAAQIKLDEEDSTVVKIIPEKQYTPQKEYFIYAKTKMKADDGMNLDKDVAVMFITGDGPFYLSKDEPIDKDDYVNEGVYKCETVTPEKVVDNIGYEHVNVLGGKFTNDSANMSYPVKNTVYREYYLAGDYTQFKGKIVMNGDNRYMEGKGNIKVYADEKLAYSSKTIEAGFIPEDVSVDMTGVQKLRIEFCVEPQEFAPGTFFEAYIGSARLEK